MSRAIKVGNGLTNYPYITRICCLHHYQILWVVGPCYSLNIIREFCLTYLLPYLLTTHYHIIICEGGLGSRNSVCLSVRLSHAWIVTKLNDALRMF